MRLAMSMWLIFRDDWGNARSWSRSGFLAMIWFSPNQGPWFSRIHTCVLYPEEYSTVDNVGRENIIAEEILFRGVLRHYVSQNIDAITDSTVK